ncbi:DUF2637 domain-containing protein [Streptomyces sp. NPDC050704]|uniref:DUF2637 domain-containing protein n=1 Tax=Streptomyces sp. NPDC050704 TaxID=3157219 RepID=UPI00342F5348
MRRPEDADRPRPARRRGLDPDAWVRPLCALVVAGVAAYVSYVHQRDFASQGGADAVTSALWPLSVDGLLLLATAGLLKPAEGCGRRSRYVVWVAFLLGIAVSLAANIAAAAELTWKPVLVAGWPPVALLLSVELLVLRPTRRGGADLAHEEDAADLAEDDREPLLERARQLDARHRDEHQRPVSAETLRKELHVGAQRSRRLVAQVRQSEEGGHFAARAFGGK